MAKHILENLKLYVQEYDLSGYWNSTTLELRRKILDSTKFGSGGEEFCPDGLKSLAFVYTGFFNNAVAYKPDDIIFPHLYGTNDLIATLCPTDGSDGEVAYCFKHVLNYTPIDGAAGDVAGFAVDAKGTGEVVRGTILKNATSDITEGGTGTTYNIGSCAPGQTLYAYIHDYEDTGDGTLSVDIYSDTASGMATEVKQIEMTDATDNTVEAKTSGTGYLFYDGQSANYAVDSTLTGGTSGATATILADTDWGDEGVLTLGSISGTFEDGETITDAATGSATVNGTLGETYLTYDNEASGPFTVGNTITGGTSGTTGTLVALQDDGATGKMLISTATGEYDNNEEISDGTATADVDGDSSSESYWRAKWTYDGTACKFILVLGIK